MKLIKIILVIIIIFLLYKICTYKENVIIEGHLGYTPETGPALDHKHETIQCLDDSNQTLTGDENCNYGPSEIPTNAPQGTPSAVDIINNFHINDLVLAQFKQEYINQNFLAWVNNQNQSTGEFDFPDQKAEVESWFQEGNLLIAKVVNFKNDANLILVEFMLPQWITMYDENHTEQHWVTPGAPGRLRNQNDNWKNYHITIYPEEVNNLPSNWNTTNWTTELSGYAYDNNNNVYNNDFIYGGIIHYNTTIYSNISDPSIIKNNHSLIVGGPYIPMPLINCLLDRGEETIDRNINGRCKLYIKQTPGNNGAQNCKALQDNESIDINQKFSRNCDTCRKPNLGEVQINNNSGPLEFVHQNLPDRIRREDFNCNNGFDPDNSSTCNSNFCTFTQGTDQDPSTCTPIYSWTSDNHPYKIKCARGFSGQVSIDQCGDPGDILYEKEDGTGITQVSSSTPCVKTPTCKSPFTITQEQINRIQDQNERDTLTNIRDNSLKYFSVNEGPDESYLNQGDFRVTAKCKPGYFNIPPATCSDSSITDENTCISSGSCSIDQSAEQSLIDSAAAANTSDTCLAINGATWISNVWSPGDTTNVDVTDANVTVCDAENQYYNLQGCDQQSPCFSSSAMESGRNTTQGQICLSNKTSCDSLISTGESIESAYSSPTCTSSFNKSTGRWIDIDENDTYGCGDTCNLLSGDLSKKKLKIWQIISQDAEQAAANFADGPQSYNIKTTSKEDKIKVLRGAGTPNESIITILKGDELLNGDIRIGYYGHYMEDDNFWLNYDVQGSTHNNQIKINDYVTITDVNHANYGDSGIVRYIDGDTLNVIIYKKDETTDSWNNLEILINISNVKDNKKWNYIDCDRADPSKCVNQNCNYEICSKHCISNWQPSDVDFTKINANSKIYNYNEIEDVEWGNCMKRDNTECGTGFQARVAMITEEKSNGGDCFFPNEHECKPRENLTTNEQINAETNCPIIIDSGNCNSNNLCQWVNKQLTNNSNDRYEYRKCRGDTRGRWDTCATALNEYMRPDQGFPRMKDDFRSLSNQLTTPTELNCTFTGNDQTSDQCPTGCTYTPSISDTQGTCTQLQMVGGNSITCPTLDSSSCTYPCQWDGTTCTAAADPGCQGLDVNTCEVGGDSTLSGTSVTIEAGKCSWNAGSTGTPAVCEPYVNYEPFTNQIIEGFEGDVLPCNASTSNPINDFYYNGKNRIQMIEQLLPIEEQRVGRYGKKLSDDQSTSNEIGLIDKINTLNQLQLDYETQDQTILPNGQQYPGLLTINFLQRFETNIPQEIYDKFTTPSIDSGRAQRLITSIPIGGNVSRMDWYKLFCIRIIYILELINLITINKINNIINNLKNDHPSRLCDKYLLPYTYLQQKYQIGGDTPNIGIQKENWNIYPFQWMYGGENDSGLNSQNQDEVILYFVKLIRIFYYPCNNINYNELDPMEQYIRFNLNLYRYAQINEELINICQEAKEREYRLFRDNNNYCEQNLKLCGENQNSYPQWFQTFMDNCNNDFTKCMINDDGSLSTPDSISKTIKKWKCSLDIENQTYSQQECCDALDLPFDTTNNSCNRDISFYNNFTSDLENIQPEEDSSLLSGKKQTLKFNSINQDIVNETNNELRSKNVICGFLSESECGVPTTEFPERANCAIKSDPPNQGRCVFQPNSSMLQDKFKDGTSKLKKDHNLSGLKWDEWLYILNNGTSTSSNIYTDPDNIPAWTNNQKWIEGIDWRPGESIIAPNPNGETINSNWELNVTLPGETQNILDYGENKKNQGSEAKYLDSFCTRWRTELDAANPDNICSQIETLTNEILSLEDQENNLVTQIAIARVNENEMNNREIELNSEINEKEQIKTLLLSDISSLRNRPEQCQPCDNCVNCIECPAKEDYGNAKGICPPCSCSSQITDMNESLNNQCNSILQEKESKLERRNLDQMKNVKLKYDNQISDLNNSIKESDKKIDDIKIKDAICKKEKSTFSVSQDTNTTEYLRLIDENESLQKEYNTEKSKSWIEKLLF